MKDKLKSILTKIKNNKKKVIGITASVFAAFIFTFAVYNLNNPTYFNRLFANVLNNGVPANSNFEDNTFYSCVVDAYNGNHPDNKKAYTDNLTDEELASITSLYCQGYNYSDDDKITSTKGIEKLTGLEYLELYSNQLTNIDISSNTSLTNLNLSGNQLTNIDVSKNTSLTYLTLSDNQLTNIDVSKNTSLTYLNLSYNHLTNIDVSKNTALIYLGLWDNQLTNINVSKNTSLTYLHLSYNQLVNIDVNNNTFLTELNLSCNHLTNIDISKNIALTTLDLNSNKLTSIDISKNTSLMNLYLASNKLTSIDLSSNTSLTNLDLGSNQLTTIDVSNNISLTRLFLNNNSFENIPVMILGETYVIKDNIKVPSDKKVTYSIEDTSIAKLENGVITALQNGTTRLVIDTGYASEYNEDLKIYINFTVQSSELSSNIYNINNDLKYIYTRNDTDINTIVSNVSANFGEIQIENNILKVTNNGKTLLTYNIINYVINDYTVNGNVITGIIDNFNKENINVTNGTYEINDNLLYIKDQNNNILEAFNLEITKTSLSSEVYNINNDLKYIYTRNDTDINTILSNISTNIGGIQIDDNTLKVKYNDKIISEYKIISYNVTDYDTDGKYIYPIINKFDYNNISVINGSYEVDNNQNVINIKYKDNIIDTVKLVILTSSKYDLTKWKKDINSNHYILFSKPTDEYQGGSEISVTNASIWASGSYDKMSVNTDGKTLFHFSQLKMSINNGSFGDDHVYTKNETNLDNIKANITKNYGTIETEGNMLKVLYNNEVLLEYKIVNFKIKNAVISGNTINAIKDKFSVNDIEVNNGMYKLNDDNTLNIKYNDQVIDTLNIEIITPNIRPIGLPSFDYNINDNEKYIYILKLQQIK